MCSSLLLSLTRQARRHQLEEHGPRVAHHDLAPLEGERHLILPPKSSVRYRSDLQLHDDVDDGEEAEGGEGEDGEDGADAGGDEPVRGLEVGVRAAEGVVGRVLACLERPEVARVVLARQT